MADLEINDQYDYYKKIRLDEDGRLISLIVEQTGITTNSESSTDFFNRVAFDENGKLKIILT